MASPVMTLSPEENLVISLCRLYFTEDQSSEIRYRVKMVKDWFLFVKYANEHGIIALVWHNLTSLGYGEMIPPEYLTILRSGYLKSLARNAFIYKRLGEISEIAFNRSIKIVLIKGLALEKTCYGDKGLRQMNDLDILVRQEDAFKLRNALIDNGFKTDPVVSSVFEKKMFQHGKHLPGMFKEGIMVDIHFKLFNQKGNYLSEDFINKSTRLKDGDNIFYPDYLMLFLYLINHLDKHEREGTSQLRLYADLIILLEKYSGNILKPELFELAKEAGIINVIIEKLIILDIYWEENFSSRMTDLITDPDIRRIQDKFEWYLKHPETQEPQTEERINLRALAEVEGVWNKMLFLIGYGIPSPAYLKFRYKLRSNILVFFLYPLWWLKLASLTLRGLIKRRGEWEKSRRKISDRPFAFIPLIV